LVPFGTWSDFRDFPVPVDSNLESTLEARQGEAGFGCRRIATFHLFGYLLNEGGAVAMRFLLAFRPFDSRGVVARLTG
jgi:hypothetical protein